MQMIVLEDGRIMCPGCASELKPVMAQVKGDQRVIIALHPQVECKWRNQTLRVDRKTGYGEPLKAAEEVKDVDLPEA